MTSYDVPVDLIFQQLEANSLERCLFDEELRQLVSYAHLPISIINGKASPVIVSEIISRHSYLPIPDTATNKAYQNENDETSKSIKNDDGVIRQPVTELNGIVKHLINPKLINVLVLEGQLAIWNNVLRVFQKSYPASLYNWTNAEFETLENFTYQILPNVVEDFAENLVSSWNEDKSSGSPLWNATLDYLNQLLEVTGSERHSLYKSETPSIAVKYITMFVNNVNNKLRHNKEWYENYLISEATSLGMLSSLEGIKSLSLEWLEEIISPPIRQPIVNESVVK